MQAANPLQDISDAIEPCRKPAQITRQSVPCTVEFQTRDETCN